MQFNKRKTFARRALLSAAAASLATFALFSPTLAQRGGEGGFRLLAGSWTGGGTISTTSGTERIRCRVTYNVGGNSVHQDLRCASDSYNFQVSSNIVDRGGALSGTWSEITRQVSGNVSGRMADGAIQAAVTGPGFSAGLSISVSGNRQSVTIRPSGGDIRDVSVNLMRSR